MGIIVVNKTIIPINIVVMQLLGLTPVGYGHHMNIAPGACVDLDIGEVKIKQFKVYAWCGGGPGTEISRAKIEAYIALRLGIAAATMGSHEALHSVAEGVCLDACQEFVMGHLATEVITSFAFEQAIGSSLGIVLSSVVDVAVRPKEFGVCKEWFVSAVNANWRYIYGGPQIQDGRILGVTKLRISKQNCVYDPVKELKALTASPSTTETGHSSAAATKFSQAINSPTTSQKSIVLSSPLPTASSRTAAEVTVSPGRKVLNTHPNMEVPRHSEIKSNIYSAV